MVENDRRAQQGRGSYPCADLSDQVATLSDQVAGLSDSVATLSDQVATLSDQVADLSDQVAGLSDQVAGLSDQVATLSDQVAGLSDQVAGLGDQVAGLSDSVATLCAQGAGQNAWIGLNRSPRGSLILLAPQGDTSIDPRRVGWLEGRSMVPEHDESPVQESGAERFHLLANSPWWLVSAGLHAVVLLVATIVYVDETVGADDGAMVIRLHPQKAPQVLVVHPTEVCEATACLREDPAQPPTEEPRIFFPGARESDHQESADDEDYHQMKGQSVDYLGSKWGIGIGICGGSGVGGPGLYDSMGVKDGGGSGGRYGGRFGGVGDEGGGGCYGYRCGCKEYLVARGGGCRATESAVKCALRWLARHQSADGSWKCAAFTDNCCEGAKCGDPGVGDYDAGVTGLALLAFLGAGYSHLSREEMHDPVTQKTFKTGEVVKKALKWLMKNQDPIDGCIGPKVGKLMYNHAICALALSEAYGMTEAVLLKAPAQKAIDFLVQAKNPYEAWRYTPRSGENDASVTGWCVMALKSAELSELKFPHSAMEEALGFVDGVTEKAVGKCGYKSLEEAGVQISVPDKNGDYANHEALSAVGMLVRTFVKRDRNDPVLALSAKLLAGDPPVWDKLKKTNDYYYWYYGTLALYQFDGPDVGLNGTYWKAWNHAIVDALVKNQKTRDAGCAEGSWDGDDRWGFEGGRVYATAMNALTLEIYYRYTGAFTGLKR